MAEPVLDPSCSIVEVPNGKKQQLKYLITELKGHYRYYGIHNSMLKN